MLAAGGGANVHPAACASVVVMPASQNAICATMTPPTRMTGRPNEVRERCQVKYRTSAMAQAAANSDNVRALVN